MKSVIMMMAITAGTINIYASQGPAEKHRYLLNFHITSKTKFGVYGIHDAIERWGCDINARDKTGMTPLELAQHVGNEMAVKYFLWRSVKDTNPDLAKTLSENMLLMLDSHSQKVFPQSIQNRNTTNRTTTTTMSVPLSQPTQQPVQESPGMVLQYGSPEISSYTGPKRLEKRPKDYDDDDD